MNDAKVRESHLRSKLKKMGYRLQKNRARDPQSDNYGGYMIIDETTNLIVDGAHPFEFSLSLNEVDNFTKE
jgi:hypothetical protein